MRLVETEVVVAEDGHLLMPSEAMETMGLEIGERLYMTYLGETEEGQKERSRILTLTKKQLDTLQCLPDTDNIPELSIPNALLEAADIPLEGELDIECVPGYIMISSGDPLNMLPPCLMGLFDELGISHETVREVLREGEIS